MFGVHGEGRYHFNNLDKVAWITCTREKHKLNLSAVINSSASQLLNDWLFLIEFYDRIGSFQHMRCQIHQFPCDSTFMALCHCSLLFALRM